MEANGKRSAQHLLQHCGFLQVRVENQRITNAVTNFELRRKNEVGVKELDACSVFHRKIVRRNLDETFCLTTSRITGNVKTVLNTGDDK